MRRYDTAMAGPLDGIQVLDLTAMASGPFATAVLGDQGADVIKLEPPGHGDLLREIGTTRGGISAIFATLNRNKRSLVLNLRDPRGRELLGRLVATADVFVQNFRPGVAERMGIGAETLRARNPRLVYVSISGFGERGPYAGRRVYDSIMQAYSGVAAHQANPETGTPEFVRNIICDKGTALATAQAITAALLARERGAGGQHLKLSMLHAAIAFLWPDGMQNWTYLGEGGSAPMGARATLPAIRQTADGFITLTAINDREFQRLCRALGRPELVDDARFAEAGIRMRNAAALHDIVNPITRALPTAELVKRLEAEDVPHAVINTPEHIHEDLQVIANELLVELDHPSAGRMRQPRPVGDFEATPGELRRPAPGLGEHSDEILAELGLPEAEITALREAGLLG